MKLLNFVDVATLNMISTQNPYDKLFHLSICIRLKQGYCKIRKNSYDQYGY